jgi:hypothetical protein
MTQRDPPLREDERYPTLRYNSPPVPPFLTLLPRGMVGYEERKREERQEARRDRATLVTKADSPEDVKRWAFISKLACTFPRIGVQRIAEGVVPWDVNEFKCRVVEAETKCQESMLTR